VSRSVDEHVPATADEHVPTPVDSLGERVGAQNGKRRQTALVGESALSPGRHRVPRSVIRLCVIAGSPVPGV